MDAYPSEPRNWNVNVGPIEIKAESAAGVEGDPVHIDIGGEKMIAAPQGQTTDAVRREAEIPVTVPRRTTGPGGSQLTVDAPQLKINAEQPALVDQEQKSQANVDRGGKIFARSVTQRTAAAPGGVEAQPQQGSRPTEADAEEIVKRESNAPKE